MGCDSGHNEISVLRLHLLDMVTPISLSNLICNYMQLQKPKNSVVLIISTFNTGDYFPLYSVSL